MSIDSGLAWSEVLRLWRELEAPEGWRPEIMPEGIFMSPPPSIFHNQIHAVVSRALTAVTGQSLEVYHALGVGFAESSGVFIPDLCVVPVAALRGSDPVPGDQVVLAVEITSPSNARVDRTRKKWAYGHAGIPQYLLIDAHAEDGPTVSLFSNPVDGAYRNAVSVGFGQKITLADPVPAEIDTGLFPSE